MTSRRDYGQACEACLFSEMRVIPNVSYNKGRVVGRISTSKEPAVADNRRTPIQEERLRIGSPLLSLVFRRLVFLLFLLLIPVFPSFIAVSQHRGSFKVESESNQVGGFPRLHQLEGRSRNPALVETIDNTEY